MQKEDPIESRSGSGVAPAAPRAPYVGVDGAALSSKRRGWIAVAIDEEGFVAAAFYDAFHENLAAHPAPAILGVDVPIGLAGDAGREADRTALVARIRELDDHRTDERIFEVHPEVSFQRLAGGPWRDPKKSWGGHAARRLAKGEAEPLPADVHEHDGGRRIAIWV